MPGSRIGSLAIENPLGPDPNATSVYRAIHVEQRKTVAVKIFRFAFGGTPEGRELLTQEWERLKGVEHPSIAKCFGGGFDGGQAYLAYELIEGETLAEQLSRSGRLSWENTLDVAQTLADALEYLHDQGLVHGALVPDKIIVSGFAPVLLDMRLNRYSSPFRHSNASDKQVLCRQAPEWIRAYANTANSTSQEMQLQFSPQHAELYSLGVLLYQCVTGKLPVQGETPQQILVNAEQAIPQSPASIDMQCPVWLDKLIMQLLSKDPQQRPTSASAVKLALAEVRKRALSKAGVAEHVSSGFSPLQMTSQEDKDQARYLLGRDPVKVDTPKPKEKRKLEFAIAWHDQPWAIIGAAVFTLALIAYFAWPASEASLRAKAETLIASDNIYDHAAAKSRPLRQLVNRFPDTENGRWAKQQIAILDAQQFLRQLAKKVRREIELIEPDDQLHRKAQLLVKEGKIAEARDIYESMKTILGNDPEFQPAVDAAVIQLAELDAPAANADELRTLFQDRLDEANQLIADGKADEAAVIWAGLVEFYEDSSEVADLVAIAKERLAMVNDKP